MVLSVHRKILVKEVKKNMVQKWVSIALIFPLEFRVSFCAVIALEILAGHNKNQQRIFLNAHRENVVKEKCRENAPFLFLDRGMQKKKKSNLREVPNFSARGCPRSGNDANLFLDFEEHFYFEIKKYIHIYCYSCSKVHAANIF